MGRGFCPSSNSLQCFWDLYWLQIMSSSSSTFVLFLFQLS